MHAHALAAGECHPGARAACRYKATVGGEAQIVGMSEMFREPAAELQPAYKLLYLMVDGAHHRLVRDLWREIFGERSLHRPTAFSQTAPHTAWSAGRRGIAAEAACAGRAPGRLHSSKG